MVMSNVAEAGALAKAEAYSVAAYYHPFPPRKRDGDGQGRAAFEREAQDRLRKHAIDLICLAGFMRIFSPEFNKTWQGRILNIHPSLLPKFPGLHPQRQALSAGVNESGCTVHFVDAGVDTGPTILQRRVPVLPSDTEDTLAARILKEEHHAYPRAIEKVLTGQARYAEGAL